MSGVLGGYYTSPPDGYEVPRWPSLYLLWDEPEYLYYPSSIWAYTVYWSLLLKGALFAACGFWALLVFIRRSKKAAPYAIIVPLTIVAISSAWALGVATVVGFVLAAVYSAAYLRMSTWVPFLWALAQGSLEATIPADERSPRAGFYVVLDALDGSLTIARSRTRQPLRAKLRQAICEPYATNSNSAIAQRLAAA